MIEEPLALSSKSIVGILVLAVVIVIAVYVNQERDKILGGEPTSEIGLISLSSIPEVKCTHAGKYYYSVSFKDVEIKHKEGKRLTVVPIVHFVDSLEDRGEKLSDISLPAKANFNWWEVNNRQINSIELTLWDPLCPSTKASLFNSKDQINYFRFFKDCKNDFLETIKLNLKSCETKDSICLGCSGATCSEAECNDIAIETTAGCGWDGQSCGPCPDFCPTPISPPIGFGP